MKAPKLLLSVFLIAIASGAWAQKFKLADTASITLTVRPVDMGKSTVSGEFDGIDRKYMRTALYAKIGESNKAEAIPLNMKSFNYDAFYKEKYASLIGSELQLQVKRFSNGKRSVYVAYGYK